MTPTPTAAEARAQIERLNEAQRRIGAMCREGRPPRMSIPAQKDDDDLFICTEIEAAQDMLRHLASLLEAREPFDTSSGARERALEEAAQIAEGSVGPFPKGQRTPSDGSNVKEMIARAIQDGLWGGRDAIAKAIRALQRSASPTQQEVTYGGCFGGPVHMETLPTLEGSAENYERRPAHLRQIAEEMDAEAAQAPCTEATIIREAADEIERTRVYLDEAEQALAFHRQRSAPPAALEREGTMKPSDLPPPETLIVYEDGSCASLMFHYVNEDQDIKLIALSHGFEVRTREMDGDLPEEHQFWQRYFEQGEAIDLSLWNPDVPEGWRLGGKWDSEDGPIVVFIRPAPPASVPGARAEGEG